MKENRLKGFTEPKLELILLDDDQVIMTSGQRQFGDDWSPDVTDDFFFGD
ncbi:MAG: hypothetical protein J5762_00490 [Clostridia bacterium]|nr:hypothetical protein [Clostridia bacterium]